jgi:hypothetical protein
MSVTEWLDGDGYPTEAALSRIELWPADDTAGALDFAIALWHWDDWVGHDINAHEAGVIHAEKDRKYARFATGGWSGNESVIGALQRNWAVRAFAWQMTARGGLHIYEYPKEK